MVDKKLQRVAFGNHIGFENIPCTISITDPEVSMALNGKTRKQCYLYRSVSFRGDHSVTVRTSYPCKPFLQLSENLCIFYFLQAHNIGIEITQHLSSMVKLSLCHTFAPIVSSRNELVIFGSVVHSIKKVFDIVACYFERYSKKEKRYKEKRNYFHTGSVAKKRSESELSVKLTDNCM